MRKIIQQKLRIKLLVFLILVSASCFAQQRQDIKGRVVAGNIAISGRAVVNLNSGAETKTDSLGDFTIKAAVSDTLVVETSNRYSGKVIINEKDLKGFLVIDLGNYELEEVVIDKYANLTPEALGLVPEGQKQYTPAEKKLKTAGEIKSVLDIVSILGGGKSFDAVINAVTGRTKRLKKELETEKKKLMVEKAATIYSEEEMVEKLNIPKDHVQGFIYYAAEDASLAIAIKEENDEKAKFIMSGLAQRYISLLTKKE